MDLVVELLGGGGQLGGLGVCGFLAEGLEDCRVRVDHYIKTL